MLGRESHVFESIQKINYRVWTYNECLKNDSLQIISIIPNNDISILRYILPDIHHQDPFELIYRYLFDFLRTLHTSTESFVYIFVPYVSNRNWCQHPQYSIQRKRSTIASDISKLELRLKNQGKVNFGEIVMILSTLIWVNNCWTDPPALESTDSIWVFLTS